MRLNTPIAVPAPIGARAPEPDDSAAGAEAAAPPSIAEIAAAQRVTNARRVAATLWVLTLLTLPVVVWGLAARPPVVTIVAITAIVQGLAYGLVRMGRSIAGVTLSICCLLLQNIAVVHLEHILGAIPFLVPLPILIAAATLEARWLPLALGLSLLALGAEGVLSPWMVAERATLLTAGMFTLAIFVVSLMHVRGIEHAFALAEKRDRARAAAAALAHDTEQRYLLIADNTDDLISLVDREGRALYLSPSHERLLGWRVEQMLGRTPSEFSQFSDEAIEAFATALRRGEARAELTLRARDGRPRDFEAQMKRVETAAGELVAITSRDITERKWLERRLLASGRLEALGRLAGGVAHDFNNLLTIIRSSTELARDSLSAGHPASGDLDSVLGATDTATKLTRQLLMFSRKQMLVRVRLDVAAELERQREILERLVGKAVSLAYDFEASLPAVEMPGVYLEQLAMNLALNGRDAMPEGGRLTFRLRRRVLPDREVEAHPAGEYLELDVQDEGTGIPDDVMPHLFEPFFSTKGEVGTGLGLATCFGIASQLGGGISVQSEVGKGTTFRVLLPASTSPVTPALEAAAPRALRRVLLVDDEVVVRDVTARLLGSSGYEVDTASGLKEARRILADRSIPLDALLTDVMLRGERGTDLLEDCRKLRPDARIIVMSGYAPDPGAAELLASCGAQFLAKPFGREKLMEALRGQVTRQS